MILNLHECIFYWASEEKDNILVRGKVVWVYADQKLKISSTLPENLINMITSFEED